MTAASARWPWAPSNQPRGLSGGVRRAKRTSVVRHLPTKSVGHALEVVEVAAAAEAEAEAEVAEVADAGPTIVHES